MGIWGSRLQFKVLDEMYSSCGCKPWYTPLAPSVCCCCPCWFFIRSCPCPGTDPVPKQCPLAMVSNAIAPIPAFSCFSCHTWILNLCLWRRILDRVIPGPLYPHSLCTRSSPALLLWVHWQFMGLTKTSLKTFTMLMWATLILQLGPALEPSRVPVLI